MKRLVEIVPLGIADPGLLSALCEGIARSLPLQCQIGDAGRLPAEALDTKRGQYHATRILAYLDASHRNAFRLLGVTNEDLFTPIMRYLFGEAMLPGKAALVSTYRLGNALPQSQHPNDYAVFVDRVVKEGIHELGHTFGLTHCQEPRCVMAASLDMTRIDAKSAQLCDYCSLMLKDGLSP